jgi:hypothetical protein
MNTIIAEIENCGEIVKWNRLGLDKTEEPEANKIGTTVEWFQKIPPYSFSKIEYLKMLEDFKKKNKT